MNGLARFRVTLGFLLGAIVFWLARPTRTSIIAGATAASVGEIVRIWAAGHLHKSRDITSSGPYRWCAHPLYLGSTVMGVGLAMAAGSMGAAILIATYVGVMFTLAARREEAFLRRSFGDQYDRYRRGELTPEGHFRMARAVANGEHRALIGLLAAIGLLALKARANG
jgi:protein-S-isoprenylcysteine O-methyltransferase Ste14